MTDKPFQMPGLGAAAFGHSGQPFADMSQALHWMQNMWSSYMNSPMAPTFDPDELDRRIKDLKAVEQWLAINQGLLRTTIQGLEIQRAGMASLRAMMEGNASSPRSGAPLDSKQASTEGKDDPSVQTPESSGPEIQRSEYLALEQANQWWGFLHKQFEQLASHASASGLNDSMTKDPKQASTRLKPTTDQTPEHKVSKAAKESAMPKARAAVKSRRRKAS